MKKFILFLFAFGIILSACEPDPDEVVNKGKLDPNAMITIRPGTGVQLRSTVSGLTALEIVEQARSIKFQTHYLDDGYYPEIQIAGRGFNEETMKDFNTPALLMLGIDVINAQGKYIRDFTTAKSVFITDVNGDTLAYVSDEVINTARPLIESAYANADYNEVYRVFNEAFTFVPIE